MIYLFGNYRALGELSTIDKQSYQGKGVRLRDLALPSTSLAVCACMNVYIEICVCEDLVARGYIKRLISYMALAEIFP